MRNTRLMTSGLLVIGAMTMGCRSVVESEVPSDAVSLEVRALPEPIAQFLYSGLAERERLVIRDADAWAQFWNLATSRFAPQPPVPELDFDVEIVLVTAMGTRTTGGFSIHIDEVHEADERVYVEVREVSPGAGCAVTQAFTSPVAAVSIPRRDGSVTFVERTETRECD